ncbi:hypothetical protein M1O15_23590 [Streptomyces lichenis]|uniref:Uncharacterized protein n=1 Tax=Streptomyces lichenis TaxID=2306967 RepID=A0ABT0IG76_9ACTN|nr:hypothetical protein [Streptomyces lichenis]
MVAAAVEVAAESAQAGTYTSGTARVLTAVVVKAGTRLAVDAEARGFSLGWREAVGAVGVTAPDRPAPTPPAPVFPIRARPEAEPPDRPEHT